MPEPKPIKAARPPDGHADPTLRAVRHLAHRTDAGDAFLPDPSMQLDPHAPLTSDVAESFGEEFIVGATSGGEDVALEANDEIADDEDGGPFLVLDGDGDVTEDDEDDEDAADVP